MKILKLPVTVQYNKHCFPTLMNEDGMIGSILKERHAEHVAKACNEYPVLLEKIKTLEEKLEGCKCTKE